jgi:hypothetical protein
MNQSYSSMMMSDQQITSYIDPDGAADSREKPKIAYNCGGNTKLSSI